ncbi:hypothetical protein Tco_0389875 [Tanacetum coccineum]
MTQLPKLRSLNIKKEEKDDPEYIDTNPPSPPDPSILLITEKVRKLNSFLESLNLVSSSSNTQFICIKENDRDVMFVELIKNFDDSSEEELEVNKNAVTEEELGVECFDKFPTRSKLAYHKYLICALIPSLLLRNPSIVGGSPSNLKIPCNIGHVHVEKAYIDLNSPINIMTQCLELRPEYLTRLEEGEVSDKGGVIIFPGTLIELRAEIFPRKRIENFHIIMEYLVNISKRRAFWSLNEDILKITILKTNTPYPSRKLQCIRACTHQRPQRKERSIRRIQ